MAQHESRAAAAECMQAAADKAAEATQQETREREAALAAEHNHTLELKAAELAAVVEEKAKLQALVDESAAAHKAHAELKELRVRSKCATGHHHAHILSLLYTCGVEMYACFTTLEHTH